jgi:hypothetical protein
MRRDPGRMAPLSGQSAQIVQIIQFGVVEPDPTDYVPPP